MPQTASQLNPFMLMMNPEVVLAAIEKSEGSDDVEASVASSDVAAS